ncbi:MAG: ABC transporter substrate-binding protein [Nocardiopsaceae bacterium]|nr:ABC transporter substrate-binding protein [Nocardiopsaceae bacterium]
MKRGLLTRALIVVAACGMMTAAGCSAPKPTSVGQASAGNSGGKYTPISDIASCPSGPQGKLNYVGDIGGPYARNFNPFTASANTAALQSFVYEPLLQYSLSQSRVAPWLASSYAWSDGGRSLSLNLRHNVKWSDGKPFTSADVVFTFNLLKKKPATNLKGIQFSSVKATGPYSVTMTFAKPAYTQLYYIGTQYIVPQHIWAKIGNPSTALNLNPVGTGPYTLTKLTTQSLVLTANPHYWQPHSPCIKTIDAPPYVSNTTADLAMEQDTGTWGGLYLPGMSRYTSTPGNDYWNPPTNDVALYPNLTEAPFNSLPLRQAISLALNRNKIEQLGEQGEETPISNRTGIILPRDRSQLAPRYAKDDFAPSVTRAKSVLKAAGYTWNSSGTLLTPAGKPVAFSILAPSAFSDWISAVQEVTAELSRLGIKAKLDSVPNTQWLQDMEFGHFQMGIESGQLGPNSFYQYDGWLSNSVPVGHLASTNFERYSSSKADSLISSYLGTQDPATQNTAMAGLEKIMVNDVPVIPLYYATYWGLYVTKHISGWPSPSNPYEIASSYDTPMNEVVLLHLKWKG